MRCWALSCPFKRWGWRPFGPLALAISLAAAPAWAVRFDIVVDSVSTQNTVLVEALQRLASSEQPAVVYQLSRANVADPIEKGKFLSKLAHADLLVPIGETATRFVAHEFPETPIFFIGTTVLEGHVLERPQIAGILTFDPGTILQAASAFKFKRVGMAYTPAYSGLAERIALQAVAKGITLVEAKIDAVSDIVLNLENLFKKTNAVWILGDPMLARGAGFQFLMEKSFAHKVPVITASQWGVERGALFSSKSDSDKLAIQSADALNAILAADLHFPENQLETATGGVLLYNEHTLKSLGLKLPRGLPWQPLR